MYQLAKAHEPFSTDGYFFSPLLFSHTDTIEALQLAIILGVNEEVDSEVILVAHSNNGDGHAYQLAIVGRVRIVDGFGQPVDIDGLRGKPIAELSEAKMRLNGWTVMSKPYFIWLRDNEPLNHSKTHQIHSSAYHQLLTLSQLM